MLVLTPEIIEIIGIAGGMLVLAAWAAETAHEMKRHKVLMDLQFSVVSLIGQLLLALYAAVLNLPIFFWLGVAISFIILFEIWYSIHIRKIHKNLRRK
jgi:hypothetical protein